MILTCEECETRYALATGLLGADGHRVRCTNCGHEWFQEPEEGESFADMLAKSDPIPDSVKPDIDFEYEEPERQPPPPPYTEPAKIATAPAAPEGGGKAGYVLAGAVLLIGLAGAFVFSASIVRMWPPALAVYQALHIAPKLPGDGLLVDRVRAEVVSGDRGLNILKISGYALNRSEEKAAVKVPPLRVTIRCAGGEEIDSWLIAAPQDELGYEDEVAFNTTYPAPPMDAKEVNVRLEPFATVVHVKRDGEAGSHEVKAPDSNAHADKGHDEKPADDHKADHAPAAPAHAPEHH